MAGQEELSVSELVFLFLGEVRHLWILHLFLQLPWGVEGKGQTHTHQMRQNNNVYREKRGDVNVSAAATHSLRCTTSSKKHRDAHLMSWNNEAPREKKTCVYVHKQFTQNLADSVYMRQSMKQTTLG